VIAVCAVRTGCGKSQTSRAVTGILKEMGKRVAAGRRRRVQLDPGQPETFFPENIRPTVLSVVDRLGCGIMNAQDESSTLFSGHAGIEP
jgi:predicted GTPase